MGAFYFPNMSDSDPIQAIDAWQKWYKNHSTDSISEPKQPLISMTDNKAKEMWMQKAQEHFADTLCEYQYELTGKDFYKAFYKAAYENMQVAHKEYERSKELVDMLRYHGLN